MRLFWKRIANLLIVLVFYSIALISTALTRSSVKPLKQISLDFSFLKEFHTNKLFLSTL